MPVAKRYGYSDMVSMMGSIRIYQTAIDLECLLRDVRSDDIVHVHAEPGLEAGLAAECRKILLSGRTKIVLDVHDSEWGRGREAHRKEQADMQAADVIIVPSVIYEQRIELARGMLAPQKPSSVVHSAALFDPIPSDDSLPTLGGIVYEGGIGVGDWRDYRDLFSLLCDAGARVFCYAPNAHDMMPAYHQTGAVLQMRPYRSLLVDLTRHDWALVCPPNDGNHEWWSAMPNKFFEALASGLPVLTYGCSEVGEIVKKANGAIGHAFNNRAELLKWSKEIKCPSGKMRDDCRAWAKANGLMSQQAQKILKMYDIARAMKGGK